MTDGKKRRGTSFNKGQTSKFSQPKQKISYVEFGHKVISGFGRIDMTDEELKEQIIRIMPLRELKIKDMSKEAGLNYDLCRRFKQIAEAYEPIDIEEGEKNDS